MWLLLNSVYVMMLNALQNGVGPTAEQQVNFEARVGGSGGDASKVLTIAGDTAEIEIKGVLTKAPSFLAFLFGGGNTTYADIISAIAEAENDSTVKNILFAIDSPGGEVAGLFDAIAAIQTAKKPTKAVITNTGASAAYALGAQADELVASNHAARIGSVGVAAEFTVDDKTVIMTSQKAPKKRPDVSTKEGKAMVQEELDAMHDIFVDAIAEGRGTTVEKVNADFGEGATLLANEALKRGMIDGVGQKALTVVSSSASSTTASSGGEQSEKGPMNLSELQAQHPDVYAAAVQVGTDQERDRVSAHLTMGAASGDMDTAVKAVEDGDLMTASLQAKYMAAGMRKNTLETIEGEDGDADVNAGGSDSDEAQTASANTLGMAAELSGVELEA